MKRFVSLSSLILIVTSVSAVVFLKSYHFTPKIEGNMRSPDGVDQNWEVTPIMADQPLVQFQFLDESRAWARTSKQLMKTDDGGRNWVEAKRSQSVKLLKNYETEETISHIQFVSQTKGWVLEGNAIFRTTDGGLSWQKQVLSGVLIRSFHFLDEKAGWLVGEQKSEGPMTDEPQHLYGVVYSTNDGGLTWRNLKTNVRKDYDWRLLDLWPVSSNNIWVVGDMILSTADGGKSWQHARIDNWDGVYGKSIKIEFINSEIGWIITNQPGGYLVTFDGGKTWEPRPPPPQTGGLIDLVYVSRDEAWGVSRGIFHSSDGGRSWTKVLEGEYQSLQYLKDQGLLVAAGKAIAKYYRHDVR